MKVTIQEVESRLEEGLLKLRSPEFSSLAGFLQPLLPEGYRVCVTLFDKHPLRKKKKNASAERWSPESGEIRISFEPAVESSVRTPQTTAVELSGTIAATPSPRKTPIPNPPRPAASQAEPLYDLIRSLERAEARPGFGFVALKWFRDTALPAEGLDWARSESARDTVLRDAIEKRFVLTSKVPNPKPPHFPVTSLRLNRALPQVKAILGAPATADADFDPISIRGESLSATVLRERR